MCSAMKYVIGCLLCVTLTVVLGAPVSQQDYDQLKAALKSKLKEQENALESLASDKTGSNGVEYSKTNSYSYSNVNGAESQTQETEDKVSEPDTQHMLSDFKENFNQQQQSAEEKPISSFKASLDIPDEGIHKEISNDDVSQDVNTEVDHTEDVDTELDAKDPLEFTPKVVAEYLLRTGETEDFQSLLNDLVESSEITSQEAEQYEMAVMGELYQLEQEQQDNMNDIPSIDSLYPQGFDTEAQQSVFPMYDGMQGPRDIYPLYGFGSQNAPMKMSDEEDNYINYLLNKPVTLDDMINQLLNQWLNRAIKTGDPEAEEILSNIVDFVSQDNDPNDEAQVKSILGDIFAEALLEDLTPRIEPQELQLGAGQYPMSVLDADEDELKNIIDTDTDETQKDTDMVTDDSENVKQDVTVNEGDVKEEHLKM